ncbi:MAG: ABC transporter substrate-binding protein [Dehalococcoidia bacterium]|nr:MAG: ABC transporter substrate-binding protein [Dehalococcoidia bacterium]
MLRLQAVALLATIILTGCASGSPLPAVGTPGAGPSCPAQPLNVVAAESFYGSIALQLGGACVRVFSVISSAESDPHEYQIDAQTARAYQTAQVVFQNGLGYDEFSEKVVSTLSTRPIVVTFGEVLGLKPGDNPHLWYHPQYVERIAAAMTAAYQRARPEASAYFEQQARTFREALREYQTLVEQIRRQYAGTPVGATESIAVYLTEALGLRLLTPPQLLDTISEGGQPSLADVTTMQQQIEQRQIRVLIVNAQTESPLTRRWAELARARGVPVVEVSEVPAATDATFQAWQVRQLRALLAALGG